MLQEKATETHGKEKATENLSHGVTGESNRDNNNLSHGVTGESNRDIIITYHTVLQEKATETQ